MSELQLTGLASSVVPQDYHNALTPLVQRITQPSLRFATLDRLEPPTHDLLMPAKFLRHLFPGEDEADIRGFAWRAVRTQFNCIAGAQEAKYVYSLSDRVNSLLNDESGKVNYTELVTNLNHVAERTIAGPPQRPFAATVDLFINSCSLAGFLKATPQDKTNVYFPKHRITGDSLYSAMFGIPTRMPGFDTIFFSGGICFPERILSELPPGVTQPQGRVVLIKGRFGTGKSTLALLLAAEVAKKGGMASIVPLEQSPGDCLHILESMAALRFGSHAPMVQSRTSSVNELRGFLSIIPSTAKKKLDTLLSSLNAAAESADKATYKYPLRVLVVDPMNSVDGLASTVAVRLKVLETLEKVRATGISVILVSEDADEHSYVESPSEFLANVADTVICLSIDSRHGYAQRFIEIKKSRLQVEHRGRHPFRIQSGSGIVVYPSSASVAASISGWKRPPELSSPEFGIPQVNRILGENAFQLGDLIVLHGEEGTFKTQLGALFLKSTNGTPGIRSSGLFISARDSEDKVDAIFRKSYVVSHVNFLKANQHRVNEHIIAEARHNFIQPGEIFAMIERRFSEAEDGRTPIDRVLIDNIEHWEMTCPFIREDDTFIDTLVELLRSKGVVTLMICGGPDDAHHSVIQSSVLENADVLLRTRRINFRGTERSILNVQKTRGMRHRVESFDMELDDALGLRIEPDSALLRFTESGRVTRVSCELYLHRESRLNHIYNKRILESLRPVLRNVELHSRDRSSVARAMPLSRFATVDELQVVQLDEFQVPELVRKHSGASNLSTFIDSEWQSEDHPSRFWDEFSWLGLSDPVLQLKSDGRFAVVPYYLNIGLLAYSHKATLPAEMLEDWEHLAVACAIHEKGGPDRRFFAFSTETDENYNCLFFEILLATAGKPKGGNENSYLLQEWLLSGSTVDPLVMRACRIFRCLCMSHHVQTKGLATPSIRRNVANVSMDAERITSTLSEPLVSRHWYSTLCQWSTSLSYSSQRDLRVRPLPKNAAVAGDWYLAVPACSAAPLVGLKIMKILAEKDEQLRRVRDGVGLPTNLKFYKGGLDGGTPWFTFSPAQLLPSIEGRFRRSSLACYSQTAELIANHLRQLIEIPGPHYEEKSFPDDDVSKRMEEIIGGLVKTLAFVQTDEVVPERV